MDSFFGIGFLELAFIAILALIVLGPERLPKAMREVAKAIKQLRELSNEFTAQFSEELKVLDELNPQKLMNDILQDTVSPSTEKSKAQPKTTTVKTPAKPLAEPETASSPSSEPDAALEDDSAPESDATEEQIPENSILPPPAAEPFSRTTGSDSLASEAAVNSPNGGAPASMEPNDAETGDMESDAHEQTEKSA